MSLNVYAAKRALFALLAASADLSGVQVAYAYPAPDAERVCVYGGGVRFVQVDAAAEPGALQQETATVGVYVRVNRPDSDVYAADVDVETYGNAVCAVVAANPRFAGADTVANVTAGQGDYAPNQDGTVSILALQVQVDSFVAG